VDIQSSPVARKYFEYDSDDAQPNAIWEAWLPSKFVIAQHATLHTHKHHADGSTLLRFLSAGHFFF